MTTTAATTMGSVLRRVPRTCAAADDFLVPLGDPREDAALISSPVAVAPQLVRRWDGTVQARLPERELMMPSEPSAAQLRIPGLF